jgi:DNA polymerase-3 subunit alpha
MDSLGRRSQLFAVIDKAIERAQKAQRDAEAGQSGLFGMFDEGPTNGTKNGDELPNVPDWDQHQRLQNEKEVLGFFVSGHPLEKYRDKLLDFNALPVDVICQMKQSSGKGEYIYTGGMLSGARVAKSKKGDMYAQATLEDMTGSMPLFVFSKEYAKLAERIKLSVPVLIRGQVMVEEGSQPKISAQEIIPLDEAQPKLPNSLKIKIPVETATPETIDELHLLFSGSKGDAKVLFDVERTGDFMAVMEADGYNVLPDRSFINRVEELCGKGSVRIID